MRLKIYFAAILLCSLALLSVRTAIGQSAVLFPSPTPAGSFQLPSSSFLTDRSVPVLPLPIFVETNVVTSPVIALRMLAWDGYGTNFGSVSILAPSIVSNYGGYLVPWLVPSTNNFLGYEGSIFIGYPQFRSIESTDFSSGISVWTLHPINTPWISHPATNEININLPPVPPIICQITSEPQSVVAIVGDEARFSVSAVGTGPLRYQWYTGTTRLNSATNDTFVIRHVSLGSGGNYYVTVSDDFGSVTSVSVSLTVNPAPLPKDEVVRTFTIMPVSQVVAAGMDALFRVGFQSGPDTTVQWKFNGVVIPFGTQEILSLTNVQPTDAGTYTATLSWPGGSAVSNPAVLDVTTSDRGGTLVFNNHFGQQAPMLLAGSSSKPQGADYLVQLYAAIASSNSDEGLRPVGAAIPFRSGAGAGYFNASSLRTITNVPLGSLTVLQVRAWKSGFRNYEEAETAGAEHGRSPSFTMTFPTASGGPPPPPPFMVGPQSFQIGEAPKLIGTQQTNYDIGEGNSVDIGLVYEGVDVRFVWFKDGIVLDTETNATLHLSGAFADAGNYQVVISNPYGSLTSPLLAVSVHEASALTTLAVPAVTGLAAAEYRNNSGAALNFTSFLQRESQTDYYFLSVAPQPVQLLVLGHRTDGKVFSLKFDGQAGQYRIDITSDFQSWIPFRTVDSQGGTVTVEDIETEGGARFYRAVRVN